MKYNGEEMTELDVHIMIAFLQTFWNFRIESNSTKELLFALRQTLFMTAISAKPTNLQQGVRMQVESLEAILKEVTFDCSKLKLHSPK